MPSCYALKFSKEQARILSILLTAPERDRDLRDAAKAMEIDKLIQELTGDYDAELEELIDKARKLNRRFAGRTGEPEYTSKMEDINTRIEELDAEAAEEDVELLLETAHFNFVKDKFLDIKNVPADRKNGPKYQALRDAINNAQKVLTKKASVAEATEAENEEETTP